MMGMDMGMKYKSKGHQLQVKPSTASETSGTSSNGSPSKIRRFPKSFMSRFHIAARRQQQRLNNTSPSPTNRRYIIFFGFAALIGLHMAVVNSKLQKSHRRNEAIAAQANTAAASAFRQKSKKTVHKHRKISLEELEKAREQKIARAAKRLEDNTNRDLAELIAKNVPLKYDLDAESNDTRKLTVQDIDIGEFVGDGAINIVATAILPDWWYEQHKVSRKTLFVVKIAGGRDWHTNQADRECDVIETLSRDKKKAQQYGIIPAVFMSRTIPNPFKKKHIPSKFPRQLVAQLRETENVVVIVQPFMDLDFIHDINKFDDIRYFIRSLLQILEYAHNLGINNFDLSDSNVRVDEDGEAVVMDWNANRKLGEDIYDPVANLWFTAPEGLIQRGPRGETIRLTSISAMDIWSVGIMLIFMMYEPCQWANPDVPKLRTKTALLRAVVQSVGGETIIPIGDNQTLDLAPRLGLKREILLEKKWKMPLYDVEQDDKCDHEDTESYLVQYSAKNKELDDMTDFLKSMMKLSPAERPNATSLLNHPFMDFSYNDR
ncbi:MAG: hypothetical protein SGBAC_007537 [Bacillariaceae sp.]